MSILDRLRKPTLRELCRREYGEHFVVLYDQLARGIPIGGIAETVTFLEMVEAVKEQHKGEWRKV